jgi:hypothetical protein
VASTAAYHADLDSEHFRVSSAEGLAEGWEDQLGRDNKGSLQLVAEVDGRVIGSLSGRGRGRARGRCGRTEVRLEPASR